MDESTEIEQLRAVWRQRVRERRSKATEQLLQFSVLCCTAGAEAMRLARDDQQKCPVHPNADIELNDVLRAHGLQHIDLPVAQVQKSYKPPADAVR